jgi:hypothetical protein
MPPSLALPRHTNDLSPIGRRQTRDSGAVGRFFSAEAAPETHPLSRITGTVVLPPSEHAADDAKRLLAIQDARIINCACS